MTVSKQVFDVEVRKGRKFWKVCGTASQLLDGAWVLQLSRPPVGTLLLVDSPVSEGKRVGE